jgi:hypothetical protein
LIVGSLYPDASFFLPKYLQVESNNKKKGVFVASLKGGGWKQGRVADGMDEIRHVEMDTVWIVSVCRKRRKKQKKMKEKKRSTIRKDKIDSGGEEGRQIFFSLDSRSPREAAPILYPSVRHVY